MPRSTLLIVLSLAFVLGCESRPPSETVIGTEVDDAVQREVAAARGRLNASEGGRLVLRAIDAHGGLEAWYRAPTSAFTWAYASRDADLHFETRLVADNRTRRIYHDLRALGPYGDPRPVGGRFAWDGAGAWIAPDSLTRIDPAYWAPAAYDLELIPFVLAAPGLRYERLPDDTLDGRPHHVVRVGDGLGASRGPGRTYTLYLHKDTGRVEAVRYRVTSDRPADAAAPPREVLLRYGGHVTVDGLAVPTHLRGFAVEGGRLGPQQSEARVDSLSFRRPFDEARLRAPEGARHAAPPEAG